MYKDLDETLWPEDQGLVDHEVIGALLGEGFPEAEPRFAKNEDVDDQVDPADIHFVKDADSTQTVAALEAMTGKHMVIQGPPGTGKSQTITNIIAECLGVGKTVLFVAEKMAALEVVKRRLDEVHIGDAVLELHSHKSNKKAVIQELGRTLKLGKPQVDDGADDLNALRQARDRLNAYCREANKPILKSGVSFVDALGFCLQLKRKHEELPRFEFAPMKDWSASDLRMRLDLLEEVSRHIDGAGKPSANPFFASQRRAFSPTQQANLSDDIERGQKVLDDLLQRVGALCDRLGLSLPRTVGECKAIARAAQRAFEAPHLEDVAINRGEWQKRRDDIRQLLRSGRTVSDAKLALSEVLIDAAWKADLVPSRQAFRAYGGKWYRFFIGSYRKARKDLLGLSRTDLPGDDAACLAVVDRLLDAQSAEALFSKHRELGETLFGSQWQELDSDWEVLALVSDWIIQLYDDIGQGDVPEAIVEFLSGELDREGLDQEASTIVDLTDQLARRVTEINQQLEVPDVASDEISLAQLRADLSEWHENVDQIYQQVRYRQLQDQLDEHDLAFLVEAINDWPLSGDALVDALKLSFYEGLVNDAYENRPAIRQFDRTAHQTQLDRFRSLDELQMVHAQGRLAVQHYESIPRMGGSGQIGIINHELNKKRAHLPIRKLIQQAGKAIQTFKPVFMMSPMSIAQYLAPGSLQFDVVIFDEASQVKTVDAFGAIARGKQVIVVGDTKQMPPTDFFGRGYEGDDDEESATGDIESVLGLFLSKGAPQSMLQWHYRSRHESLIAVSNYEFYENKLIVFPSAGANPDATGLHLHHLPDTVYDRGKSRTNKEEAKAVAEAIMRHSREQPHLTLGVVAFSTAQRDSIIFHVDQLRRLDDAAEEFFADHPEEPFFVKNLENVQGDERDVIMISIGYGKDAHGRLSSSFGPVNRDGGQRRLNVLISRAKQVMHVFSNFRADDLQVTASSPFGVRALKHFLKYAEDRQLDIPEETGKEPDSPFEEEVIGALRSEGYDIEPQVGTAGYFIDLAVRDPDKPGRYLLAIECDGAAYHSSRSARDRDRLRQSVLEGLGWCFHRVWSTDWFRNPYAETERIKKAIEEAKSQPARVHPSPPSAQRLTIEREEPAIADADVPAVHYRVSSLQIDGGPRNEIHAEPAATLARLVARVVDAESPVHIEQVTRRLLDAYGINRAGRRVQESIQGAISAGTRSGLFENRGVFLYRKDQREFPFRDRSGLETAERKVNYVAPEEWEAAIVEVVRQSIEIEKGELVSDALRLLGFKRATGNASELVEKRIDQLSRRQVLNVTDGRYCLA